MSVSPLVPIADPPIPPMVWFDHWAPVPSNTTWRTQNRRILYRGQPVILRGINFHGVESECRVTHGLWKHPLSFYMDLLQNHKFNAVRVPLSYEVMSDLTQEIDAQCLSPAATEELESRYVRTVGEYLGVFMDMAWERGMVTLFDLHTINGTITEYPWTKTVHERDVLLAWANVAEHFSDHPGLLGFEVKNEPHGTMRMEEFDQHCARVIWQVRQQVGDRFQGLWFIGGVQVEDGPWGGTIGDIGRPTTLENITHPSILCTMNVTDRIVFSPHVYGPDVRGPRVASEGWDVMERRFGYLYNRSNHWNQSVILATEIGGFLGPDDLRYYERWRDYVQTYGMDQGSFWWTLPETSKDTGGLLIGPDWSEVDPVKMKFIESLHPNPTLFSQRKS